MKNPDSGDEASQFSSSYPLCRGARMGFYAKRKIRAPYSAIVLLGDLPPHI